MQIAASSGSIDPSLTNTRREFLGSFNIEVDCAPVHPVDSTEARNMLERSRKFVSGPLPKRDGTG
jgi:hypothetical protein